MNLPTSETTPDRFNTLPPSQKRRIRLAIKNASEGELDEFLHDELQPRSATSLDYFLFLLLSAFVLFLAIVLDSPLLLLVAALAAPFNGPILGTMLSALIPSWSHFIRSLVCLIVTAAVYFAAGWLAGMVPLAKNATGDIPFTHLLQSTWLEWVILILAAGLFAWLFLRQNETPRLTSALLSYLIFFPLAISGWLLRTGMSGAWSALLLMAAARLAVTIFVGLLSFWLGGLPPRRVSGWLIFCLTVALTVSALSGHFSSRNILSNTLALHTAPPPIGTSMQ
ncbi:MAG: hypothetical protein WA110_08810, partial [Anaerolineaceae bacterium]